MKKFLTILTLFLLCFAFNLASKAISYQKWLYPKQIKTYIPPNHNRTLMMKHAFAEWSRKTNNNIVFRYQASPDAAQIRVHFVTVIPNADREIGLTKSIFLQTGKLTSADIYIADKTSGGRTLGKDSVYTVMLHEIGHAIGISEHSKNPKSIMYPTEDDIQEILNTDLKTLSGIYGW